MSTSHTKELTSGQNAKVERLAEALEDLAIGIQSRKGNDSGMARQFLDDARTEVRLALREFMVPSLRLIEGGGHQKDESIPKEDVPVCKQCKRDTICEDEMCPYWHKAVQTCIDRAPPIEPPPRVA